MSSSIVSCAAKPMRWKNGSSQPTAHTTTASCMNPSANRLIAYACLALSMSLVGSYVALSKPLVAAFPVLLLGWLRFGIAALAMLPWLKKPAAEAPMTPQTRRLLFLESFFGNFLFSICMLYGISLSNAVSAGVVMASIPAVIALMGWAMLGERVAPRVWAAAGCAVLGQAILAFSHAEPASDTGVAAGADLWLGNLLLFGAVLCEAAYTVIGKKLTGSLGPKRISALINLWGFALMTPLGLYLALQFDFGAVALATWTLLVFYALAASVGTVWLWMTGASRLPVAHSGIFTVMLPISAVLVGVLVLGESLSALQLLAFAIALAGIALTWNHQGPA